MRARRLCTALALMAGALGACSSGGGTPTCSFDDPAAAATSSPWRKFHADDRNTGAVANTQIATNPGQLRWVFPPMDQSPKGAFVGSPVINSRQPPENRETLIYIGSVDGTLYAVNVADGTQNTNFSFAATQSITSTPVVAVRDGGDVLFVGAADGVLYGLTSTGAAQQTNWPDSVSGSLSGAPLVAGDGTVYVGSQNGLFAGVCPNGVERFALSTVGVRSSPAAAPDGTLYFGGDDRLLRSVQPNGNTNWTFATAGTIQTAPVFDTDTNSIYIADRSGRVFKVGSDGHPCLPPGPCAFAFGPVGPISSSPALAEDHVYFGSDDGNLYAIDKCTGALAWQFPTGAPIVSSPAVAILTDEALQPIPCPSSDASPVHERIVVVGSNDGSVYFLQDNDTGVTEVVPPFNIGAPVRSSPAIGSDGTVYVGADDGRVYAIGAPVPTPAAS